MRIKLTQTLPIPSNDDLTAGKVFEVVRTKTIRQVGKPTKTIYIIKPGSGRMLIGVQPYECEVIQA